MNDVQSQSLKSPRFTIEPFSKKYLTERYVSWLNDPLVVKYSELRHSVHTLSSCSEYCETMRDQGHFFWAIVATDDSFFPENLHVGNVTAHQSDDRKAYDLGILIGERRLWGRGIGCEAWTTVCSFLRSDSRVIRLTAGVHRENVRMNALAVKSGMVLVNDQKKEPRNEGQYNFYQELLLLSANQINKPKGTK